MSGGFGTRLRPLTYSQQKQLIPVANKPILFYAIEDLIEAGIKNIVIIVGPNKEQVIKSVKSKKWKAKIDFIYQDSPRGLAHAVKISESKLKNHSFIMYLGDNILKEGVIKHIEKFEKSKADCSILLTKIKNPERFGVAKFNKKGELVGLVEKPKKPPSNLALVGVYIFKPTIFNAVKKLKPSWRNELEITEAIQHLIDKNKKVISSEVDGWWKDTGLPEDILDANRLVLDSLKPSYEKVNHNVLIKGRVKIGNSKIEGKTVIKGPSLIGDNCIISNSYIGPYTSIGNNCRIYDSEIEDSIVMDNCQIMKCNDIVDSLIGKGVKIIKNDRLPSGRRLVIGDQSEIWL